MGMQDYTVQEESKGEIVFSRGWNTEQPRCLTPSPLALSPKPLLLRLRKQRPPKAVRENAWNRALASC